MFFSKEINRQRNVKQLLPRKTDILKTCRKSKFFGNNIWRYVLVRRGKRYKLYSGKRLCWHCCLKLSFVYKTVSHISFNLFCAGDKRLLSEFLRKWGQFQRHNGTFPQTPWLKIKISKNWDTALVSFCYWKTLTFLLVKEKTWKRSFNTISELSQNRTEKQIMQSKTTINWLFNDIWCYLFINLKTGLFQQTAVRVYYIFNLQVGILQSHYRLTSSQIIFRDFK